MAFLRHDYWFSALALGVLGGTAVFGLFGGQPKIRRTPLDGWLVLFVLTAVVGWWIAPQRAWAAAKLGVLLASVLVYYLTAGLTRQRLWLVVGLLSGSTAALALYFLLAHNWQQWPADVAFLNQLGVRWMIGRPFTNLPPIHPNKTGGLLAVFLPLAGVTTWRFVQQRLWGRVTGMGLVTFISLLALLLSSSRGAWLALFLALILAWLVLRLRHRGWRWQFIWVGLLTAVVLLGMGLLASAGQLAASNLSRPLLAHQTIQLIRDYPFTGGGLVSFGPLYSQYICVIPFFFFSYAHNLYLDIWLEQGSLALLAFIGLLGGALALLLRSVVVDESNEQHLLRFGVLAGLLTLLLHGWVDDALYGTWGTPHLLLLVGLTVVLASPVRNISGAAGGPWWLPIAVMGVAAVFLYRPLLSAWYANWGAVRMAQVELAEWPLNRWDDGALAQQVDETYFRRALVWDETNGTALYRLGLVAMGRREFETAVDHLSAAHASWPAHRGIRKMLGYGYVWLGEIETAVFLLHNIPEASTELFAYAPWWVQQDRLDLARRATDAARQVQGD